MHDRNVIIARNLGGLDDMARTLSSRMIQIQGSYPARHGTAP